MLHGGFALCGVGVHGGCAVKGVVWRGCVGSDIVPRTAPCRLLLPLAFAAQLSPLLPSSHTTRHRVRCGPPSPPNALSPSTRLAPSNFSHSHNVLTPPSHIHASQGEVRPSIAPPLSASFGLSSLLTSLQHPHPLSPHRGRPNLPSQLNAPSSSIDCGRFLYSLFDHVITPRRERCALLSLPSTSCR